MIIHPEIVTTPDTPVVKFREPKDKVDLDVEIPKILNSQGWGLGTYFHIQFINHDRSELIASCQFLITGDAESIATINPDGYQPMTKAVSARKAKQIGDWFYAESNTPTGAVTLESEVKWNPGKKMHEVLLNGRVVFSSADKTEAEQYKVAA